MPSVEKMTHRAKPKGNGVLSRIAPVSLSDSGLKLSLYGRSGTGKTTLACTFPKKLLIIGAEDGTRSIYNVKGVEFVRLERSEEMGDLVPELGKYDTVVLDSASSLQDLILKEILGLSELPAQKSWGMASRDQYGQCTLQTKERLRSLLNLPQNVVIVAQERNFNTENESELMLLPSVGSALSPSVTGWLNPACDYIGQMFIREQVKNKQVTVGGKTTTVQQKTGKVDYCLRTAPDPIYTTKFRLPKGHQLPDVIVDPSYDKILAVLQGSAA